MTHAAIIVPSFNRPDQLRACLHALTRQDHPNYEIIIVDDGSPMQLAKVCDEFGDNVRCIRQDNAGPAAARNRGVAATTAAFVALTDDDCRPRPDWLSQLQQAHAGRDDCLVGGRVENGLPSDPYATASQSLCDYLYSYFNAENGDMPFFTSNNIGMSREGFMALNGFDETFPLAAAEDRDFGLRWLENGGQNVYSPDAIIDHYHAMSLSKFWRQHSNYGRGAHHLHRVLDARGSDQPKREPLGFYLRLLAWPLRKKGIRGLREAGLMAISQIGMVNGFARASRAAR